RVITQMMRLATATKERWEGQVKQAREAGFLKNAANISYEEMRDFIQNRKFSIELRNEFHITSEFEGFEAILPTLFRRKWVTFTPPSKSGGFITSDHPVCLMYSDPKMRNFPPGHGLAGTEIIFPIGRKLAAVGAIELNDGEFQLTEDGVAGVNG